MLPANNCVAYDKWLFSEKTGAPALNKKEKIIEKKRR